MKPVSFLSDRASRKSDLLFTRRLKLVDVQTYCSSAGKLANPVLLKNYGMYAVRPELVEGLLQMLQQAQHERKFILYVYPKEKMICRYFKVAHRD